MFKLFEKLNKTNAKGIIASFLLLSTIAGYFALNPKFDYDFEKFFPRDNDELSFYEDYREKFGTENDFLLFGVENYGASIYDSSFLARFSDLHIALSKVEGVESVLSIKTIKYFRKSPFGIIPFPVLHLENKDLYVQDSLRLLETASLYQQFISRNSKSLLIFTQTKEGMSKNLSDSCLLEVYKVVDESGFENLQMSGKIHGQHHYINTMSTELVKFILISGLLLLLALYFTFRTVWGVAIPLVIVGLSAVWLLGLIAFFGVSLSVMTIILPSILFVVGTSDSIHLIEKYLELLRKGHDKRDALIQAVKDVGAATFLTSVTTAIGFLTLLSSSTQPVREFGMFAALGVLLAFLITYLLLPPILLLSPVPNKTIREEQEDFWTKNLVKAHSWMGRKTNFLVWLSLGIFAISVFGASTIKVDNKLLEDLSEKSSTRQQFMYFEENFAGVRPFELAINLNDEESEFLSKKTIFVLSEIQEIALSVYDFSVYNSLVEQAKLANQFNGNLYQLPQSQGEWEECLNSLKKNEKLFGLSSVVNNRTTRITARFTDIGSYEMQKKHQKFLSQLELKDNLDDLEVRITGMSNLIDTNDRNMVKTLLFGLLLAFIIVALLMGFVFKSLPIVLASLLVNTLPLMIMAGIIGFFGVDLNTSKSIFFTIAFGIAVDDTIHFLVRYKQELEKGLKIEEALRKTFVSTGKAILVTSLMLFVGFGALVVSEFSSVKYLGIFVSISLFFAVLADLFLLPILLSKIGKYKEKKVLRDI